MSAPRRSVRELLAQIARDEGLEEGWEPESAAQRALLDLAALPHAFNARIVAEVLLPAVEKMGPTEDASFAWLVAHEEIEQVPGSVGIYRMRNRTRTERVESWIKSLGTTDIFPTTPDDTGRADRFVDTSQQLADLLASFDERWELERLYQLIAADPAAAVAAIGSAYAKADAEFDLIRCFEILTILDERDALLTDVLIRQREDLRRYYDSRRRWTEAYTQSAFALERQFMREAFDWTRAAVPEWIGVLEARGGMGKSMFIRWLISRKCVPEPARIPCARIDFDFPLPALLAEHPWLLIPQLVTQLEGQLRLDGEQGSTTELQRLAAQVQEQVEIALESQDAAQGSGRALTPERSQRFGAEMAERFGRALAERAQGPVLIVFDTIEEAFLRAEFYNTQGRNVIESALELLSTVHDVHPQLKVIFAGRFSPSGRDGTGDFATRYAGKWQRITLKPFGDDESHAFLTGVRHVPDDARVASIIAKGGGLPLVLALWADIVLAREDITAAEIDASPEADLAYLIERVIDRLHDPRLQWVIRYGVIPRRLTRAFFDGVLVPAMREAMRGHAPHDNPARDRIPAVSGKPRFRTDLLASDQDLHPDELWDDLALYVSNSSFVYRSPDDDQAIAFHVEVVEPMRRLLRADQPDAFRALHMDAVRYHEGRAAAATTPEQRAAAMREAIYHLLQANPGTAGTRFEQWVDQARDSGDTTLGKVLVEELLSPEYATIDATQSPLGPALIGVAHVMRLESLVTEARDAQGGERGTRWVALVHAAAEYRKFLASHPALAPRDGRLEEIEAEATLNTQGAEAALPLFEAALERAQHDHRRLSASLGAADAADRLGHSDRAAHHAREALALLHRVAPSELTLRRRQDLARVCEALGDYDAVVLLLNGAGTSFSGDPSAPRARLVEAELASGRAVSAVECAQLNLLPPGGSPDDTDTVDRAAQAQGLLAIARMQHGETTEALHLVRTALRDLRTGLRSRRADEAPERWERRAAAIASAASARVWEQHLELAEAVDCVEQGQRDWAAVGNAEAAGDALRHRIELTLFEMGDRQLAASLIGESLYLTLAPESEVSGRLLVLRTLFQRPGVSPPAGALRGLLDHVAVRRWRSVRLLVLGAIIDASDDEDTDVVKEFVADLGEMTPTGARREMLGALARLVDRPLDLAPWAANDIAEIAGVDDDPTPADRVDGERALLLKAQIEWFLGRGPQAALRIEDLLPQLTCRTLAPAALDLARRLVAQGHGVAGAPWGDRYQRRKDASDTANGRVAVSLGELALRAGDIDAAAAWAEEAVADLGGDSYPQTRWGAMAHAVAAGVARARGEEIEWHEHRARVDRTLESLGLPPLGDLRSRIAIPKPSSRPGGAASPPSNPAVLPTPIPPGRLNADAGPAEPRQVVTLQTSWNDGLVVEMQLDGQVIAPAAMPLVGPAMDVLGPGHDDEVVPFELVRRVTDDWRGLSAELTSAVLGRPDVRDVLLAQGPPELRLLLDPPAVAALPVELLPAGPQGDVPLHATDQSRAVYRSAAGGRDIVRWVQEALIENGFRVVADGIWGAQSSGALAAFQGRAGLPASTRLDRHTVLALAEGLTGQRHAAVALVAGLREGARRATRAASTSVKEHFDVTALYRISGLQMEAPERNLVTSLQARRPVILHLRGTFDESSSLGGVVMRFGGEGDHPQNPNAPGETPSTLGSALKLLPPVYRPLVVLDPFPATSQTEVVRQLLLRNVFAHELFRLGACPAIIAVGFEVPTPERVPLAYSVMAEAWKDSLSVLDVLRRLRTAAGRERRNTSNLVDLLGTSPADACVVYASTPAYTLFARPRVPMPA